MYKQWICLFAWTRKTRSIERQVWQVFLGVYMNPHERIAERKIKKALEKGEFDNLPGQGEPLSLEDDSRIPEDLRMAYKVLKNADCLPPEIELRKEIRQMEDLLETIPDEKEKYRHIKKINLKITQLNMMGHKSPLLEENQVYYSKIIDKTGRK
jgi:hypothetical protein